MALRTVAAFAVDAAGDPEAVTASDTCRSITVRPVPGQAQIVWYVRAPLKTSPQAAKWSNESHTFHAYGRYNLGDIPGYIETDSSSLNFSQEEEV